MSRASRDPSIEVPYGWVVLAASLAIHTIGLGAPTVLFVTLKPIAADFEWTRAGPSLAYGLMMIGSGVGGIAMGWWMDRRGVMSPVLFGAVMIGVGAIMAGHAQTRLGFYVATGLLIGLLGKAAMIAPLVANATRWFDRRRGLAVAIIASGQGMAGALWPTVIHHLNESVGWRGTFTYFGFFALATMVPLAFFLRRPPPDGPIRPPKGGVSIEPRVLGRHPAITQGALWLAVLGCCGGMSMPIVHLVSHATDLGYSQARGAELLSVLFATAFVSRIAFGMLADRIGAIPTLLIGSASQATMLLVLSSVESLGGLYVAAALFGLGFAGIMPCYSLIIRVFFPAHEAGWRIATQYLFGAAGMALGGWLGGAIYDLTGSYSDAFLAGFAFNAVNLVIVSTIMAQHRRETMATAAASA